MSLNKEILEIAANYGVEALGHAVYAAAKNGELSLNKKSVNAIESHI